MASDVEVVPAHSQASCPNCGWRISWSRRRGWLSCHWLGALQARPARMSLGRVGRHCSPWMHSSAHIVPAQLPWSMYLQFSCTGSSSRNKRQIAPFAAKLPRAQWLLLLCADNPRPCIGCRPPAAGAATLMPSINLCKASLLLATAAAHKLVDSFAPVKRVGVRRAVSRLHKQVLQLCPTRSGFMHHPP
ncbi:uncharacterized protein B0I36DRAFT_105251 [Microdochium trichocladiopsis]|uniref:Uncharacterized protein n=1 Tax=Microdochium trichocladiopsis TaxID=1682393 RepID=A0A9P8Y9M2_9PEZI|nr:uncharacterized protein B0I36DRAFT_105251 [Microdochium trichocladiopsis]KAH7033121.1 hypothetical protein B0I36DRAFT_105251 [Microdochium trichocladiopsis]